MAAVVAMTSNALDLSESNTSCWIYSKYSETSVFFRHTASLSHLRTMLPKSSSCLKSAQLPNHAT